MTFSLFCMNRVRWAKYRQTPHTNASIHFVLAKFHFSTSEWFTIPLIIVFIAIFSIFFHRLQTIDDWLSIIINFFFNTHSHKSICCFCSEKKLVAQISFGRWYVFALKQTEKRKFSLLQCEYGEKFTITKAKRKRTVTHWLEWARARGKQNVCA